MKNHGGKRINSGRKPLSDSEKREPLTIYPLVSEITACGGKETSKDIALSAIIVKAQEVV